MTEQDLKECIAEVKNSDMPNPSKKKIMNILYERMHKNGWIPCSEKLPEIIGRYLVSTVWRDGDFEKHCTYDAVYGDDGIWHVEDYRPAPYDVVAWQPLPEAYQLEQKRDIV